MKSPISNILALYRIADIPHRHALLAAFLCSNFLLSLLELIGLAAIGALLVQMLDDKGSISFYFINFESNTSASIFILSIWVFRAVAVVLLNRFNHAFIQRIKSSIQMRQCDVAFASRSRSDQIETGKLFTALTNEVQMITGQVFLPGSMALAEAILVLLFGITALFIMPMGVLIAGGTLIIGYLLTHSIISPITNKLGKKRLAAEKEWSEKVVNMFSLRREAEVYGVTETIKSGLIEQISASNTVSGKFYSIASLNRATLETIGVLAILALLMFSEQVQASSEHVMFIILALVRMLPSATRILAAVQSYRFAAPVIEKQLAYLTQKCDSETFESNNNIIVSQTSLTYEFTHGVAPSTISISLESKGLIVVSGESGLGKTTMLDEVVDYLVKQRSNGIVHASGICYASQSNLVTERSIHQNLAFYRDLGEQQLSNGIKLLQAWGISPDHFDTERRVSDFSGGQKKRVSVARALSCSNAIIILDEPTSGLDRTIAASVIQSILEKAKDNLIIIATHDDNLIKFADTVFHLKRVASND